MHAADAMPLRLYCTFCNNCLMSNPSGMIGRELMLVLVQCPQGNEAGLDIKLHILCPEYWKYSHNLMYTEISIK